MARGLVNRTGSERAAPGYIPVAMLSTSLVPGSDVPFLATGSSLVSVMQIGSIEILL